MDVHIGTAWVFPANITTDDILPGRYLDQANNEVGPYAMAGLAPDFARSIAFGDFIVAGPNFGTGSGRESAPIALQQAGVGAILAPSFGRIFYRNCINIGLPAVEAANVEGIRSGDQLRLDFEHRQVTNLRTAEAFAVQNLTGISLQILRAGGIVSFTKQRLARQRSHPAVDTGSQPSADRGD